MIVCACQQVYEVDTEGAMPHRVAASSEEESGGGGNTTKRSAGKGHARDDAAHLRAVDLTMPLQEVRLHLCMFHFCLLLHMEPVCWPPSRALHWAHELCRFEGCA